MTIMPKAMKYRIRRPTSLAAAGLRVVPAEGVAPGAVPQGAAPAVMPEGVVTGAPAARDAAAGGTGIARLIASTGGSAAPASAAGEREARDGNRRPKDTAPTGTRSAGTSPGVAGAKEVAGQGAATSPPAFDADTAFDNEEDGFGDQRFPTARQPDAARPGKAPGETDLDAIRREGLTGRQLRMARRVAQKHGLAPTSDFDAVRLLRKRGIDPFERATMLELVLADGKPEGAATPTGTALAPSRIELPKIAEAAKPPAPQKAPPAMDAASRAREILEIQRGIARRRRHKSAMLLLRLAFFVVLPTVLAGIYYYRIATPLYATRSEFLIQKADGAVSGPLAGMLAGTQFATAQDSVTVQSYLQSRDAMLRLDAEHGFKAHFSQPSIDPIKRLAPDSTNEEAFRLYQRYVTISFDPSEGIVKLEVQAADPATSEEFSKALIHYAEEQVDHLSSRLRSDQMKGAQDNYADAEAKMQAAQGRVLELQEQLGVLDPISETASLMTQIGAFETELRQKRLELQALLDNLRPNQARVDGARGDIQRLEALIAELRGQMTDKAGSNESLARISGQMRIAEADLTMRQLMLQAALQQLESARIEAGKQVRYLALGVQPVAPDEATYPRKFESTLLAFLVFSGIYLMISLTASILREQVSA